MLTGATGLVAWAETEVSSSVAAILMATIPMWMVLIGWVGFAGARPRRLQVAGMVLGLFGVLLVSAPGGDTGPLIAVLGVGLAPPLWCLGSHLSRHMAQPSSSLMATALQMLAGGSALVVSGLVAGEAGDLAGVFDHGGPWLAFAHLTLFGALLGYVAYGWLLREVSPAAVSTYALVNPVVAIGVGWLWLDESFSRSAGLGALAVVVAVVLMLGRTRPVAEAAPATLVAVTARATSGRA